MKRFKLLLLSTVMIASLLLQTAAFAAETIPQSESQTEALVTSDSSESEKETESQETVQPEESDPTEESDQISESTQTEESQSSSNDLNTENTLIPPESQSSNELSADEISVLSVEEDDALTTFIKQLYRTLMHREADAAGLSNWYSNLSSGTITGADIVYSFITSSEFVGYNYSDEEFVRILYRALYNREADPTGFNQWTSDLESGLSRRYVCSSFIGSDEFKNTCHRCNITPGTLSVTSITDRNPQVTRFVDRMYRLIMHRKPDAKGLENWVSNISSGTITAGQAIEGFFYSDEFIGFNVSDSEYIEISYNTVLDRSSDAEGRQHYLDALNNGLSRRYVLRQHVASNEFKELCARYGITAGEIAVTENSDLNKEVTIFIRKAYQNCFGRTPTASEVNIWAGQLYYHTMTGADFTKSVLFSNEAKNQIASDEDFVVALYKTVLQRSPSQSEINSALNNLKTLSREELFNAFTVSEEFKNICTNANIIHVIQNGWAQNGSDLYYYSDGKTVSGWQRIDGKLYYFNPSNNNKASIGWNYINGYKYYFNSDGVLNQDVDSIIGKQSSYYLKVNTTTNIVSVYARDGANGYIIPVKNFICSTGLPATPTVKGTFTVRRLGYWWTLMGPVYGQYVSQIYGGYLFHSAWYHVNGNRYTLSVSEYRKLGNNASHGCVRLTVADAKWIYDNCNGSTVTVYSSPNNDTMFDKPTRPNPVVISGDYGYDPTDPYFN